MKETYERRRSRPGVWCCLALLQKQNALGFRHWPRLPLTEQTQVNHQNRQRVQPMYTCSTCIFTSFPVERRGPLHSIGIFYPPLLPAATFFSFQRELTVRKQNKSVAGRKITEGCFWASSFPLPEQNEMAYCNSESKYVFLVGALLFLLPRPVQEISLKHGNEYRGFLKNTHTALPPLLCTAYYLFSRHQNWAGE